MVEGPTDYLVLDALVELFMDGNDYVPTRIQPPVSAYADDQGPLGGGWKGVLKWCEDHGEIEGGFASSGVVANCEYVVIHVDADVADEPELSYLELAAPMPQTAETCDNIRALLAGLLGGELPDGMVALCVPAQCTEAWVFVALYTDDVVRYRPIESRAGVERLLIGRPERLVRDKDGAAKKQAEKYRPVLSRITGNWATVTVECDQARRFESEFRSLISG